MPSPPTNLPPLPHTRLNHLDARVTATLALIRSQHYDAALHQALQIVQVHPDMAEGYALAAHSLSEARQIPSALSYWKQAIQRDPLNSVWLTAAVKCALAAGDPELASTWLLGVEKHFLQAPQPGVLAMARNLGLTLRGGVGVHNGALRGWACLGAGEQPHLRCFGQDRIELRLTRLGQDDQATIWHLQAPLKLNDTLIIHISDAHKVHLTGSPLYCDPPEVVGRHYRSLPSRSGLRLASGKKGKKRRESPPPAVTVIVPVYDDIKATAACLQGLLNSHQACKTPFEVLTIWDAGPEPELLNLLQRLATAGQIRLVMNQWNMGFVNSVNRALTQCAGTDVVLLNADALVHGNWLDRLRRHALDIPADNTRVGTVTPFSNQAELVTFPHPFKPAELEHPEQIGQIDAACQAAGRRFQGQLPDLPCGVGFCMYIRARLLADIGGLDSLKIHRGYGEEVDFCLRGAAAGYRNRVAHDVFVGHQGGRSFGADKRRLALQNNQALYACYPDYRNRYLDFLRRDPLKPCREAISWHLLPEISGSLWVADPWHTRQPAWHDITWDHAVLKQPLALLSVIPRGQALRLTLTLKHTELPLADIHLNLPEDADRLQQMLERLAVTDVRVLGPGRGARRLVQHLKQHHQLPIHLLLTCLPPYLRRLWSQAAPAKGGELLDYTDITCQNDALAQWLQGGIADVKVTCAPVDTSIIPEPWSISDMPPSQHLMVCGVNMPETWHRLDTIARICHTRNSTLLVHGLDAWHPAHLPPGAAPLPLKLDEPPDVWKASGMAHLLLLDQDPAWMPQWLKWADARGMQVLVFFETGAESEVQHNDVNCRTENCPTA